MIMGHPGGWVAGTGAIGWAVMDSLVIALLVVCTLLVCATAVLGVAMVRLTVRAQATREDQRQAQRDQQRTLDEVAERLAELAGHQRRTGSVSRLPAGDREAGDREYVIAFDPEPDPQPDQVSTKLVVSSAFGEPLLKAAALGHGVRRALSEENRALLAHQVRREYRRRRKVTRANMRRGR